MKTITGFNCMLKKNLPAFFILFFFGYSPAFSQKDSGDNNKIDPVFREIISREKLRKCPPLTDLRSNPKTKSHQSPVSDTATAKKKYDCIVYTKNAKLLRKKGIVINSELPSFVTAFASLCEIVQMSAMPEVSKIEAPGINSLH